MRCPYCGYEEGKVIDSRPTEDSNAIRRRRECLKCQKRFTTYETIEVTSLAVVKHNNRREPYDREKVLKGIMIACVKRPISMPMMEKIADEVENEIYQSMAKEVSSTEIAERIMNHLKELDEVAYVRFASVHRQFSDIETFIEEIKKLKKKK